MDRAFIHEATFLCALWQGGKVISHLDVKGMEERKKGGREVAGAEEKSKDWGLS